MDSALVFGTKGSCESRADRVIFEQIFGSPSCKFLLTGWNDFPILSSVCNVVVAATIKEGKDNHAQ
jgi:hypothetical protein